jgi:putative transposase
MIDRGVKLPVKRQAELLGLSRSSVYYTPRPLSQRDLMLMRRIDELHLELPFYGSRKLADRLRREGHEVGRRHVATLMRRMGIEALYRRPRTSIPARGAAIYPYLLSGVSIERPNQVWASDITYLPMAHGFLYLVAILDVASRKVLAFRLSNTLTADFCVEALEEAIAKFGKPEIFNTDQGSQFTSEEWINVLKGAGIAISMDGKGRWIDNVFIERLWRLCAQGRYVAGSAACSGFTVNARGMRTHNDGAPSARRKEYDRRKDDCRKRRAASPRGQRRMRRRPKVLQRTQPVEQ